jgi:hypothetical protein
MTGEELIEELHNRGYINFIKRSNMTNETIIAKKALVKKQEFHNQQIKNLEAEIGRHKQMIIWLEDAIDALDEAETEAFNKDRG